MRPAGESLGFLSGLCLSTVWWWIYGGCMFGRRARGGGAVLAPGAALLTREGGGILVARVVEVDGVLLHHESREPVDLASLLMVAGLPDL